MAINKNKLKNYWPVLIAIPCLILYLITDIEVFKYIYRLLIALGFIKSALSLFKKGSSNFSDAFAALLFIFAICIITLSMIEISGLRGVLIPEWVWIVIRGIIDPIYYVLIPLLDRKAEKERK